MTRAWDKEKKLSPVAISSYFSIKKLYSANESLKHFRSC